MTKEDLIAELKKHTLSDEECDFILEHYDLAAIPEDLQDPVLVAWDAFRQYAAEIVKRSERTDLNERYVRLIKRLTVTYGFSENEADRVLILGHVYEQMEWYPEIMMDKSDDAIILDAFKWVSLRRLQWEVEDRKMLNALEALHMKKQL